MRKIVAPILAECTDRHIDEEQIRIAALVPSGPTHPATFSDAAAAAMLDPNRIVTVSGLTSSSGAPVVGIDYPPGATSVMGVWTLGLGLLGDSELQLRFGLVAEILQRKNKT